MTLEEWKAIFSNNVQDAIDSMSKMVDYVLTFKDIEGDYDEDELTAFIYVKLNKFQNKLEELSKN